MNLAWWLSWLERRPVTAEVVGSSPIRVVSFKHSDLWKVKTSAEGKVPSGSFFYFYNLES